MMPDVKCAEEESEAFRSFLGTLQADHIRLVVKADPLIKELSRRQSRLHQEGLQLRTQGHQHIASHLRHQSPMAAAGSSTDEEYQTEKTGRFAKRKKLRPMTTRNNSSQSRRTWSVEEVTAVETHLLKYIVAQLLPGKGKIQTWLQAEKKLKSRTWLHDKNYVRNRITSLQRKQGK